MKLKPKHIKICKNIGYFVDRNYYPDFVEPSRKQMEVFIKIESVGKNYILSDEERSVQPMLNGKQMYDLQINMIHEELAECMVEGWGWKSTMESIYRNAIVDKEKCEAYIEALDKIIANLEEHSLIYVMLRYSGFTEEFKDKLCESINRHN